MATTMFRAATLALVTFVAGCGTTYLPTKSPDAHLLASSSAPEVRAAIIRALAGEHHTAESESAGRIVARLGKPDRYARVAIEYSDTQYVVRYLDGTMKTRPGADGDVLVEKRYAAISRKLAEEIDSELQRPAREQAQAERYRQDYELLLQQSRTAQAQAEAASAGAATEPPPPAPAETPALNVVEVAVPYVVNQIPTVEHRSTVRHSEQSLTCCINGARYNCPSQDAFQECFRSGPSHCTRAGRCK